MANEKEMLKCPHCGTLVEHGLTVCKGCLAKIEYGATFQDSSGMGCGCAMLIFIIAVFFYSSILGEDIFLTILGVAFLIGFIGNFIINKDSVFFRR